MSRQYITNTIWYNPEGSCYIMLDVTNRIPQPDALTFDGVTLFPKDEYHVSLLPLTKLSDDPDVVQRLVSDVTAYLQQKENQVSFVGLGARRFICTKSDERTLIVEATVSGLQALRHVVSGVIGDYQPAFPHVTLLKSANSVRGIGINSLHDLQMYCRELV